MRSAVRSPEEAGQHRLSQNVKRPLAGVLLSRSQLRYGSPTTEEGEQPTGNNRPQAVGGECLLPGRSISR